MSAGQPAQRVTYRVGSHYGIHIYEVGAEIGPDQDRAIATASTPEDAELIVAALNGTPDQLDPDSPSQQECITRVFVDVGLDSEWSSMDLERRILTALRDQWAEYTRAVEPPAQDRTRRWKDRRGNVWSPVLIASWSNGSVVGRLKNWGDLLLLGPLTDAGPAGERARGLADVVVPPDGAG